MANKVEIDIVAQDLASAALDLVKNKLMGIGGTAGMVGVAAVTMGAAIVTGLNAAKDAAQAYDQQVKELMLRTGGTAEETSRLIQTVDDAGISYETLSTAMRFAVKNGIEPNIQSIAKLSDEYLALNGPVERGQYLLDKFGRSGMDMARIMDMGGEAIMNMSDAVQKNLIVTDKAIQQSEEYRVNVDNLKDAWEGYVVLTGNQVIPVISDEIGEINNLISSLQENGYWYTLLHQNTVRHTDAVEENSNTVSSSITSYTAWAQSLNVTTSELGASDEAMKAMSATNMGLLSTVKTIQAQTDSYKASLSALSQETYALEQAQAAMGTRTEANAAEWDALSQKIWENNLSTQQLARDNEMAMKKIAADLYIAKLSADGLTDAEYKMAIQALIASGQIDEATADMALNFEQNLRPEIQKTKDEVVALGNQAQNLAKDYYMNFVADISVNYNGTKPKGNGSGGSGSGGGKGNGDVPKLASGGIVSGPRSGFDAILHGTEAVIPLDNGRSIPVQTQGNSGGMVVNLTYAPTFSAANRDEMQNILLPFIIEGIRQANLR